MKKINFKKAVFLLAFLFILGLAALFFVNEYVKSFSSSKIISFDEAVEKGDADCVIVLGCKVYENGPGPMLRDRLEKGTSLYEKGAAPKILMSGDHGRKTYDEVNAMKKFALDRGLPSEDVFMDHAGFSTYETMYRARDVFECEKVIIVTQEYHLYRSLYIAEKLGLDAYGVACDTREYPGQLKRDIREVLARNKDFLKCIFKPKPTYLGEVIPISGDGNLTND